MNADTLVESSRVRDAASCREWLARLGGSEAGRLPAVDRLMRNLMHASQPPDALLEIAEQARPVHLAEIDGVLGRIDAARVPMADADRQRFVPVLDSLRLGRDLFRRIHGLLVQGDGGPSAREGAPSLRVGLPLARALDYQVRLLHALLRHKTVVDAADWDELCELTARLRTAGFIDVPLPDATPLLRKTATPRALFAFPLLLWLGAPGQRSVPEFDLTARLARRWCGRVGFRFDAEGSAQDVRHGPLIWLTARHSVRLITHRLRRRLEDRRRELELLDARIASRLPSGMTPAATRRLLSELAVQWCEPRQVHRVPDVRLGEMRLRFGMPKRGEAVGGRVAAMHTQASRAYVYGQFDHDTIVRQMAGGGVSDPLSEWAEDAQPASWVSIERQQALFEMPGRIEGLHMGGLAMVVAPMLDGAAPVARNVRAPAPKRMFGRVVSLAQQLPDDPKAPATQRIGIAMWSGDPVVVGIRVGEAPGFDDAFLLAPDPATGEPHSIVMPSARFVEPGVAMLREGMRESKIRLEALLDRGIGFDRVQFSRIAA